MYQYQATSTEKHPTIKNGIYNGIWTAYNVQIIFENGNHSEPIKMNNGIRGVDSECKVEVLTDGTVNIL